MYGAHVVQHKRPGAYDTGLHNERVWLTTILRQQNMNVLVTKKTNVELVKVFSNVGDVQLWPSQS